MSETELTRAELAAAARSLLNTPWLRQGRDPDVGLDCAGVLVAAFKLRGITLEEEPINYRRLPAEAHVLRCLELNFIRRTSADLEEGDILHLKFNRDTAARHLAIVVGPNHQRLIVHCTQRARKVVLETLAGVLNESTINGIYSWPKF